MKKYDLVSIHLNIAKSWPENLGVGKPYITDERIEDYIQALAYINSGKQKKANQLFEEVINSREINTTKSIAAEDVIVMAAYMHSGEKQKAEILVNAWQESFVDDIFIQWTANWLKGDSKSLTSPNSATLNQKIGTREYYLQWVADFLIDNPIKR